MSKFELSLSKEYVPDWDYVDGVRELFQNALDQEMESEENKMFFEYDEENETLRIGNKTSVLDVRTLLLGETTKKDNDNLIGQFGEGYKVATLVLAREGSNVVFNNYGNREVWKPRFVKSRRYGTDVLTFFIEKKKFWESVPNNNLVVEIDNISKEKYEKIKESNLNLQEVKEVQEVDGKGRILGDKHLRGRVFVNGLYVCDYDKYEYGYDFEASELKLDRDRKLVSDFDLRWLASQMWNMVEGKATEYVDMVERGVADTEYVTDICSVGNDIKEKENLAYDKFIEEHGIEAVPVSSNAELESVREGYKAVVVSRGFKELIESSDKYEEQEVYYKTSYERLKEWIEKCEDKLSVDEVEEFNDIIGNL